MPDKIYPVYTLENKCHDCYRCVRECFVKSIEVTNSQAKIIKDKCIACGHCVRVCPQNAKRIRNDVDKAQALIKEGHKVIVSLAPSWAGVFEYDNRKMVAILKALGFYGVSETALGAQCVSIETAKILNNMEKGLLISSACPVVVDYIRYYKSEFTDNITKLASPALSHAKLLKEIYNDIKVVFIGPCIAKKNESDSNPDLMDVALTFDELNFWIKQNSLDINSVSIKDDDDFIPSYAHEGALYPIEGGMNETIKMVEPNSSVRFISTSSLEALKRALSNLSLDKIEGKIFLEALSCSGGCVNGPCISSKKSGILINSDILAKVKTRKVPKEPDIVANMEYSSKNIEKEAFSVDDMAYVMKSIGKTTEEDELNCGGCGYATCRELALAILSKKAEASMCVSYMRQLATKKTALLLKTMPSAMVTVNKNLEIIEANDAFIRMFMNDMYEIFSSDMDVVKGALIDRVVPFASYFESVIAENSEIHKERYKIKDRFYDINVFPIEAGSIIGAIITDVTTSEGNKEKIAKKAKDVINKNIEVVQNIASLLGEHMVETEMLLNSIAEDFSNEGEE